MQKKMIIMCGMIVLASIITVGCDKDLASVDNSQTTKIEILNNIQEVENTEVVETTEDISYNENGDESVYTDEGDDGTTEEAKNEAVEEIENEIEDKTKNNINISSDDISSDVIEDTEDETNVETSENTEDDANIDDNMCSSITTENETINETITETIMYSQTALNVRSGPGTSYPILGTLCINEMVIIIGDATNGWQKVKYEDGIGYVSAIHLGANRVIVNNNVSSNDNDFSNTNTITQSTPTNNTAINEKTIAITYKTYEIPDYIPQGDLNDNEYTVLCEMLYAFKYSEEETTKISTLLYGTEEDARNLIEMIEEYVGADIVAASFLPCNEEGRRVITISYDENGNKVMKSQPTEYIEITLATGLTKLNIKKAADRYKVVLDALEKAGVYDGMTENQAVYNISHWIVNHMTYVKNGGDAYVGFTTGEGQCMTYALMFKEMCDAVGIECEYVSGYTEGGSTNGHAWNRVNVNDVWYWIDLTWCDNSNEFKEKYYLAEELWPNHLLSEK